jgi:hypothetical protein
VVKICFYDETLFQRVRGVPLYRFLRLIYRALVPRDSNRKCRLNVPRLPPLCNLKPKQTGANRLVVKNSNLYGLTPVAKELAAPLLNIPSLI